MLPGTQDDAVIDRPGITVTHTTGTHTINSLTVTGNTFQLNGGTLDITRTLRGNASFEVQGGTLADATVAAGTTVMGTSSGGVLSHVTFATAAVLDLATQTSSLDIQNGLSVNGTANLGNGSGTTHGLLRFIGDQTIGGTGNIVFGSAMNQLVIANAGSPTTVTVGAGITIHGQNGMLTDEGMGHYILQGTIGADSGGSITINPSQSWENSGTITANYTGATTGGTIHLQGGPNWVNRNVIRTGVGNSTVDLESTTTTANLGLISGVGSTGGGVHIFATIDNTGHTLQLNAATGGWLLETGTIQRGTVETSDGARLDEDYGNTGHLDGVILNGSMTILAGAVQVMNGLTVNGLITLYSGTQASDGLIFTGTAGSSQTVAGTGTIRFGNLLGGAINVASGTTLTLGPGLTVTEVDGVNSYGQIQGLTGSVLVNQGTITAISGNLDFFGSAGSGLSVTNTGTLQAINGAGLHLLDDGINNQGTIRVQGASSGLEIGGNQTTAGLGSIGSTGIVYLNGVLDNTGHTLQLNATTGNWTLLNNSTIHGGTIQTVGGAKLINGRYQGTGLIGVTLDGTLDVSAGPTVVTVFNGLTLTNNGVIQLGDSNAGDYGQLVFQGGNQTLGGSGRIVFGSDNRSSLKADVNTTLTIGSGVTVQGVAGSIIGGDATSILRNQGTITDNIPGGSIMITATGWQNTGTIQAANGSTITIHNANWMNNGTVIASSGGTVNADQPSNLSSNTLSGGTWEVLGNGTLALGNADIRTINAATVLLDSPGSNFYRLSTTTDALAGLSTLTASGSFTIENGRTFSTMGDFTNMGTLTIGLPAGDTGTFTVDTTHHLTNYDATSHTLSGGTYNIFGQLVFPGANIQTNSANLTIGGTQAHPIVDNLGNDGLSSLAMNNGSFAFEQSGHTFTATSFANNIGGTLTVGDGATFIAMTLSTFGSQTLMGGDYLISGTFEFGGADIHTNAAHSLVLDGPDWAITDTDMSHSPGLTTDHFTSNVANSLFCTQNGAPFMISSSFTNDGMVRIGANTTYELYGGQSLGGGRGTLEIMGGTLFIGYHAGDVPVMIATPVVVGDQITLLGTVHGKVQVDQNATLVLTGLDNYMSGSGNLNGGVFDITGILQFPGADIHSNSSSLTLEGPGAAIQNTNGVDALANFSTNSAMGSLTLTNGATFTASSAFENDGTLTVGPSSTFTAASNFTQRGTVDIQATGNLILQGQASFSAGTITGAGTVTVANSAQLNWTSGTMSGAGMTTVAAGGTLAISGSQPKNLTGRQLVNAGTVTCDSTGGVVISSGGGASFVNQGTFMATGTGTTEFSAGISFNNSGTVNLVTGTLLLDGGGASSGSFSLSTGTMLTFAAGSFALNAGASFSGMGQLNIVGATVSVNAAIIARNARFSTGTLTGSGTFIVTGTLTWTGGTMAGAGTTMIAGTLHISDSHGMYSDGKYLTSRQLVNTGTVTWDSTEEVSIGQGGTIQNQLGGMFNANNASFLYEGGGAHFVNAGAFNSAATRATDFSAAISFTNTATGMVDVGSGTLRLNGAVADSGSLIVASNAEVDVNGTFTHSGMATLEQNAALVLSGDSTETGSFNLGSGATLTLAGPNLYSLNPGTSFSGGGMVVIQGAFASVNTDINVTNATFSAGILNGSGNFTVTGLLTWTGGTMAGTGMTMIGGGGQMLITGSNHNLEARPICSGGTIIWDGTGGLYLGGGSYIDNEPGATFMASGDADLVASDGTTPLFDNEGVFFKSSPNRGVTTIQAGIDFHNGGTLEVDSGTLLLDGGALDNFDPIGGTLTGGTFIVAGTLQFSGASNFLTNDATLILDGSGPGRILDESGTSGLANFAVNDVNGVLELLNGYTLVTGGSFTNLGYVLVDFTSVFNVSGDYTQGSGATLEIQLSGVGQNGQVNIAGNANLDGTLTLTPVNGYTPTTGDAFQILTFVSRNGTDFANPPAGFNEVFDDVNGTLTVVAQ
jgi:hypothetical protein